MTSTRTTITASTISQAIVCSFSAPMLFGYGANPFPTDSVGRKGHNSLRPLIQHVTLTEFLGSAGGQVVTDTLHNQGQLRERAKEI